MADQSLVRLDFYLASIVSKTYSKCSNDDHQIPNLEANNSSSLSNLKISWAGDYPTLKNFVANELKINGEWCSPGGEKKLFTSDKITLTWPKNKKYLAVSGENARSTIQSLLLFLDEAYFQNAKGKVIAPSSSKKANTNSCHCRCNELVPEVEGTKLELVILESQCKGRIRRNEENIAELRQELLDISTELCNNRNKLHKDKHKELNELPTVDSERYLKSYNTKLDNLTELCGSLQNDLQNFQENLVEKMKEIHSQSFATMIPIQSEIAAKTPMRVVTTQTQDIDINKSPISTTPTLVLDLSPERLQIESAVTKTSCKSNNTFAAQIDEYRRKHNCATSLLYQEDNAVLLNREMIIDITDDKDKSPSAFTDHANQHTMSKSGTNSSKDGISANISEDPKGPSLTDQLQEYRHQQSEVFLIHRQLKTTVRPQSESRLPAAVHHYPIKRRKEKERKKKSSSSQKIVTGSSIHHKKKPVTFDQPNPKKTESGGSPNNMSHQQYRNGRHTKQYDFKKNSSIPVTTGSQHDAIANAKSTNLSMRSPLRHTPAFFRMGFPSSTPQYVGLTQVSNWEKYLHFVQWATRN